MQHPVIITEYAVVIPSDVATTSVALGRARLAAFVVSFPLDSPSDFVGVRHFLRDFAASDSRALEHTQESY